ncbi:hypothetical protein C9439_07305 [archaeon SCG-AAA382B04]|nr:hypothetical protein C9439_07305 [archaeon SCG-AAA382B04]
MSCNRGRGLGKTIVLCLNNCFIHNIVGIYLIFGASPPLRGCQKHGGNLSVFQSYIGYFKNKATKIVYPNFLIRDAGGIK